VGDRQRACSREDCQAERQRAQQAAWRAANPDYFVARRLLARSHRPEPEPPRLPQPLDRLPWDIAQTQFGVQGTEFIGEFGRLLVRHGQTQMRAEVRDSS